MKKLVALLLLTHSLHAQMGLLSPLGIEFPRFSAAARPAPNSVGIGTMLFNSTNGTHQYSDGTTWRNLSALPPAGTNQQTLRYDGSNWVGSDLMRNNGSNIQIGVPLNTTYDAKLAIKLLSNESPLSSGLRVLSEVKGITINSAQSAIEAYSAVGPVIYAYSAVGSAINAYSPLGVAINAESRDFAIVASGGNGYSAKLEGRMIISKDINSPLESGIEFREKANDVSEGYIGMRGTNELAVYGYGYGNYIQRWNVYSGSICYATTPTVCSDIRLKKDFRQLTHSSQKLNQLQGYQYYWKNEKSPDLQTGLIAQEVQKIFPELVKTDGEGMLSVDYVGLIPHLIEANKSLSARIEKLEAALLKQH